MFGAFGKTEELTSAADARRIIADAVERQFPDFSRIRPGAWVRPIADDMDAVLEIQAWKAACMTIGYGISCAWFPMRYGDKDPYHWPRAAKEKRRHLWIDDFVLNAPTATTIKRLNGEKAVRRDAKSAVGEVRAQASIWWDQVSEPSGVLAEARRQAQNPYDVHRPHAEEVAAFTLARLGDVGAAREALERCSHLDAPVREWFSSQLADPSSLERRL